MGPQREAGDEGPRAIDRVQDPYEFGVRAVFAVFLADHAMTRKPGRDQGPDRGLGAAVGRRHRIEGLAGGGLVFHAQVRTEQGQGDLRSRRIQRQQE